MTLDHWEQLLERDWSSEWDSLPEAPDIVPRGHKAQITLRLSPSLVARLKAVAKAKALPYHALVRSWLVEALRRPAEPASDITKSEPHSAQVNLKVTAEVLDALKARAHELRVPYHRLARGWIEQATDRTEAELGLDSTSVAGPPIKELMVLLLHATDQRGNSAVRGVTRLQKLLFVLEKTLAGDSTFYAFNYGPFNEEVNDAAQALEVAGFIGGAQSSSGPPAFAEMMAAVKGRSRPSDAPTVAEFALSDKGHESAERLRHSSPAYEQLFALVETVRRDWDTPEVNDLVDRVYHTWPEYTEKSLIRDEVERRNRRRRSE